MTLSFAKMHGLGNDFIVIDSIRQSVHLPKEMITKLANRHTGIGFDQCLLIEASTNPKIDFFYRIFNADGQEVGQCGNGARCLALYVKHYHLTAKNHLNIATSTTTMALEIHPDNSVTVEFSAPHFEPNLIPLQAGEEKKIYALPLSNNQQVEIHAVHVGNPHALMVVPNVNTIDINQLGRAISEHPYFPEQTNAGFMEIISPEYIKLRVYERGCGETQACGSGAVAAVVLGCRYHQLAEKVTVSLTGGESTVHWPEKKGAIFLTGPAVLVYEGILI